MKSPEVYRERIALAELAGKSDFEKLGLAKRRKPELQSRTSKSSMIGSFESFYDLRILVQSVCIRIWKTTVPEFTTVPDAAGKQRYVVNVIGGTGTALKTAQN